MPPRWIDRLEERFGDWAIPQLAGFIVGMNAFVWALAMIRPQFPALLILDPAQVLRGQVWRLFTFVLVPPVFAPLWMFFWLYVLFLYTQALEQEWGDFRFNLYYVLGAVPTAAVSLATGIALPNTYINLSLALAFAALHPEFEFLLFFVLPIQAKWLAWLAWAGLAMELASSDWAMRLAIAAGLLNYALFFALDHWESLRRAARRWRDRDR